MHSHTKQIVNVTIPCHFLPFILTQTGWQAYSGVIMSLLLHAYHTSKKWSSLIAITSICLSHTNLYLNVKYSISYFKKCDSLQLSKLMN